MLRYVQDKEAGRDSFCETLTGLPRMSPVRAPQMQAWQFIKDEWDRIAQLGTGSFLVQSLLRAVLESLPARDDMLADAQVRVARWTRGAGRPMAGRSSIRIIALWHAVVP